MRYLKLILLLVVILSGCGPKDAYSVEPVSVLEGEVLPEKSQTKEELVVEPESNENSGSFSETLTKEIVWEGVKVAMTVSCPEGKEALNGSSYYICRPGPSASLQFEWLDGTVVPVPHDFGELFLGWLHGPEPGPIQWTMTGDEKYLLYLKWPDDKLIAYDVKAATQTVLMSFLPIDYEKAYSSDIQFLGWNESQTKFGIAVRNELDKVNYPKGTKVFILTIQDGKLVKKSKYNLPVWASTRGNGVSLYVDWVDDNTIGYYDLSGLGYYTSSDPYNDDSHDIASQDIDNWLDALANQYSFSDEPWKSEYARFYDVD